MLLGEEDSGTNTLSSTPSGTRPGSETNSYIQVNKLLRSLNWHGHNSAIYSAISIANLASKGCVNSAARLPLVASANSRNLFERNMHFRELIVALQPMGFFHPVSIVVLLVCALWRREEHRRLPRRRHQRPEPLGQPSHPRDGVAPRHAGPQGQGGLAQEKRHR